MADKITQAVLDSIRVLYRDNRNGALWGIPYLMNHDLGQEPRHIWNGRTRPDPTRPPPAYAGYTIPDHGPQEDWVCLGFAGRYGSMSSEEKSLVDAYLARMTKDGLTPQNPHEWTVLPPTDTRPRVVRWARITHDNLLTLRQREILFAYANNQGNAIPHELTQWFDESAHHHMRRTRISAACKVVFRLQDMDLLTPTNQGAVLCPISLTEKGKSLVDYMREETKESSRRWHGVEDV